MKTKAKTKTKSKTAKIRLVATSKLRHIEGFSKRRVAWLKKKILKESIWTKPVYIEREHGLVMDGQHRMEVARAMGLVHVPCVLLSYDDVDVWSLRQNHEVTPALVIQKSLRGDLYPYKTVKHRFPAPTARCQIPLATLKRKAS